MSHDARPFLDTIRAAMARDDQDAGPWLVYGDWLEERGECELAESIRVACELETLGPGRPVIPCIAIDVGCDTSNEIAIHAVAYWDMLHYRTARTGHHIMPPIGGIFRLVTRNTMSPAPSIELDAVIKSSQVATGGRVRLTATPAEPDPLAARRETLARRVGELEQAIAKAMPHLGGNAPALTWRRGLVIELSAEWRAWLAHGDAIVGRHPVVAVQFICGEVPTPVAIVEADLKGRWPDVAFSWPWRAAAEDFRHITGDRLYEAMLEQPVRPGDTLEWLPMWGEERGGGPAGGS